MIKGIVTAELEPIVHLEVFGDGSVTFTVPFFVDTGFDSFLSLPPDIVTALSLPFVEFGQVTLADSTVTTVSIYQVSIRWDGQARLVYVHEMERPSLIGMSLLHGYKLTVEAKDSGAVLIEANP